MTRSAINLQRWMRSTDAVFRSAPVRPTVSYFFCLRDAETGMSQNTRPPYWDPCFQLSFFLGFARHVSLLGNHVVQDFMLPYMLDEQFSRSHRALFAKAESLWPHPTPHPGKEGRMSWTRLRCVEVPRSFSVHEVSMHWPQRCVLPVRGHSAIHTVKNYGSTLGILSRGIHRNHKGLWRSQDSAVVVFVISMSVQPCANMNGRVMPLNSRVFVAYSGSILLAHTHTPPYPRALQEVYRKVFFEVRVPFLCPKKQDLDRCNPEKDSEF